MAIKRAPCNVILTLDEEILEDIGIRGRRDIPELVEYDLAKSRLAVALIRILDDVVEWPENTYIVGNADYNITNLQWYFAGHCCDEGEIFPGSDLVKIKLEAKRAGNKAKSGR